MYVYVCKGTLSSIDMTRNNQLTFFFFLCVATTKFHHFIKSKTECLFKVIRNFIFKFKIENKSNLKLESEIMCPEEISRNRKRKRTFYTRKTLLILL